MSPRNLPEAYLKKCQSRLKALGSLYEDENFSDVVRESQEIVELCSKAILRMALMDPPHRHDLARELAIAKGKLDPAVTAPVGELETANHWLRREREMAFYGADDFDPTEGYSEEDGKRAYGYAELAVKTLEKILQTAP